jgi:hypothetical protein
MGNLGSPEFGERHCSLGGRVGVNLMTFHLLLRKLSCCQSERRFSLLTPEKTPRIGGDTEAKDLLTFSQAAGIEVFET